MQSAFNSAKCSLTEAATLAYPLPNSTIALTTDVFDLGIGACLEQHTERGWQPISLFSKKLKKSKKKYITFVRELLALYEALRDEIGGTKFHPVHRPSTLGQITS